MCRIYNSLYMECIFYKMNHVCNLLNIARVLIMKHWLDLYRMICCVMGILCITCLIEFVCTPCSKHYKMLYQNIFDNQPNISYIWNYFIRNFMNSGCMLLLLIFMRLNSLDCCYHILVLH